MMLIPLGRVAVSLLLLACIGASEARSRPNGGPSVQSKTFSEPERSFESRLDEVRGLLDSQLYGEAERAARKAIELRRTSHRARYLLGVSLSMQNRNVEEALENLTMAAEKLAEAHLELSRIYVQQADFPRAIKELDQFRRKTRLEEKAGAALKSGQLLAK